MTDAITHAMPEAMTDAMTRHYEALIEARMRLASMMTRQAVATTELTTDLMATLVGASLGTATAVWWSALGRPTRSARSAAAAVAGGTAELDDTDDPSRPDEAVLVAAVAELMRVDQAPTEQELLDELLDEQLSATNDAGKETIDVLFRLPAAVNAEEAYLCGDFNDWSTTADAMNRLPDGSFELVRRLPLGRRWRFRYLLDSDRWENDWAADGYAPNALGDEDSVVDLNAPSASQLVIPDS
jgi:hypothetical protein